MTAAEILEQFPKLSALVVGDICLDRWCQYDPAAADPSRETGIPRIGVVGTEVTPGAGGTVANNLAALKVGRVAVLGAIGDDGFGFELTQALAARGIESDLLVKARAVQTFTYTKLLNSATGVEDQPRVDFINTRPLAAEVERQVLDRLSARAGDFDVVLIADQAETDLGGVITPSVRELLGELAGKRPDQIFWADSRLRPELFRNVIVKPNRDEAVAACKRALGCVDYQQLRRLIDARLLLVTHGPAGVLVMEEGGESWAKTRAVDKPVDICGAGDSFSSGAAMSLAAGASAVEAARIGNLVASVTIMKRGTGTASPEEVAEAANERE